MKNRNVVLLALAIGCGLVAAFLTAKLGANNNKTEMTMVPVATKNLDQGLKLDEPEKLFVKKPFPKESVPQQYIEDISALKGKVLERTLRPGSHVTNEDITPKKDLDLPVRPDGTMYKAMAIKVDPAKVAGGLVIPGTRVDVISFERFPNGKVQTNMVLQNVLIVAVNAIARLGPDQTYVKDAATVTVAVTQREAMILTLAEKRGEVTLLMRDKIDTTVSKNIKPIETVDAKRDDDGTGGSDTGAGAVKVPVPKNTIESGTMIDEPSKYFEEKEFPATAIPESAIKDMSELKGQTLKGRAYKDLPVVKAAFEGDSPKVTSANGGATVLSPSRPGSTMTIQVGTSAPTFVHYNEKNRLTEDGKAPSVAPAGPAGTPASPPIKGEDEEKKIGD